MDLTAARTNAIAEEPRTVFRNDRQQDDQTRRPIHQSFVVPGQAELQQLPMDRGAPQIGLAQPWFGPTCESTDTLADVLTPFDWDNLHQSV
jgi:hypothetical protein